MLNVVLLFGGRSAEHEVSILSARSVASAAPKERITITPLCVARDGKFVAPERSARILAGEEKSATGDADFSFEAWSRSATFTGFGTPRERSVLFYAVWLVRHERAHVAHIERAFRERTRSRR